MYGFNSPVLNEFISLDRSELAAPRGIVMAAGATIVISRAYKGYDCHFSIACNCDKSCVRIRIGLVWSQFCNLLFNVPELYLPTSLAVSTSKVVTRLWYFGSLAGGDLSHQPSPKSPNTSRYLAEHAVRHKTGEWLR